MDFKSIMSEPMEMDVFIDAMDALYKTPEGKKDIRNFLSKEGSFSRCIGIPALKYLDGEIDWDEFVDMVKVSSLDYYNETNDKQAFAHLSDVIAIDKREKGIDI